MTILQMLIAAKIAGFGGGSGGGGTVVVQGEITCTDDGEGNITITQGEEDE